MSEPPPALSVVIATTQGWPDAALCLDALRAQAAATGAEIVIADGSGRPPPDPGRVGPGVVWRSLPGAGVFELRAAATREARGAIVAVTEDHCVVGPRWCARILEVHARHPEAAAVKGVVANGSRERLIDWAAFLMSQAPHLPPFVGGRDDAVVGVSCVAYKRSALDAALAEGGLPFPELRDPWTWSGGIVADERLSVEHHQSGRLVATGMLQFHNARAVAGLRRGRMGGRDWIRLLGAPLLPPYRTLRILATCLGKRVPRGVLLACLPLVLWCCFWKGAGEVLGYVVGPGDSARKLL